MVGPPYYMLMRVHHYNPGSPPGCRTAPAGRPPSHSISTFNDRLSTAYFPSPSPRTLRPRRHETDRLCALTRGRSPQLNAFRGLTRSRFVFFFRPSKRFFSRPCRRARPVKFPPSDLSVRTGLDFWVSPYPF